MRGSDFKALIIIIFFLETIFFSVHSSGSQPAVGGDPVVRKDFLVFDSRISPRSSVLIVYQACI